MALDHCGTCQGDLTADDVRIPILAMPNGALVVFQPPVPGICALCITKGVSVWTRSGGRLVTVLVPRPLFAQIAKIPLCMADDCSMVAVTDVEFWNTFRAHAEPAGFRMIDGVIRLTH